MSALAERAKGRWRDILAAVGIEAKFLVNRHGPCPMCGGFDRWRFDDKDGKGTWFCTHCGAGDGVKLVMAVRGCDFAEAAKLVEEHVGTAEFRAPRREVSPAAARSAVERLWGRGCRITPEDPAGRYLTRRCGLTTYPNALRYVAALNRAVGAEFVASPAMIARVRNEAGIPVTIHRTFLTPEGLKSPDGDPRKLMAGGLPAGSAIRLGPAAEVMGVAEGTENALSCAAMFGMPVWALINAGNMEKWTPPEGVRRVVIFGDNDLSFTGQAAAFTLARRLRAMKIEAEPRFPDEPGTDFNDLHQTQREREAMA